MAGLPSGRPMDGSDVDGIVESSGLRGQIHVAMVVLGGGCSRKAYGSTPAQHVGDQCQSAVLGIITGGGKWAEISISADSFTSIF